MPRRAHFNRNGERPDPGLLRKFSEAAGVTDSTATEYLRFTHTWSKWAEERGYQVVPAKASDLAQFVESKARDGFKPNTIVAYAIGISSYHLFIGLANPATEEIKDVLAGIKRRYGSPSLKTPGITLEVMEVIENTARKPRVGRSGKTETAEEAERRGLVDIALISFMRDGLLRYEHLCDLCWGDIIGNGDGSGKVRIITSNGGAS